MTGSAYYRELALASRAAAAREMLPQRQRQHVASAERWEEMERQAADTEQRSAINEADRRDRPYHRSVREASARR